MQNELPASVLAGSPCDTALTTAEVIDFIGTPKPAESGQDPLGPKCSWTNAANNGAGIDVSYQTKVGGGLSLAYKNVKPTAQRFDEFSVQEYPAVGYLLGGGTSSTTDAFSKSFCVAVVGIRNDLAYSVSMSLSDNARRQGVDPCEAAKDVANTVLTNLKARA